MRPVFTEPKVLRNSKGAYYIYYRYNGKVYTFRRGLNYISDEKKRKKEFDSLCKRIRLHLESGAGPVMGMEEIYNSNMTLAEAADFGLEKKKAHLAPRTYESYSTAIKYFKEASRKTRLDFYRVQDIKRVHIKNILEKAKEIRGWGAKSYNKNMGYIKSVFGELQEWDIIENSPVYKIKKLKEEETLANIPPTDKQAEEIKTKILTDFPPFWYYVVTIFHTGIRPEELLCVKIGMVDLDRQQILMPPEITKTDIYRIVPINHFLLKIFTEMNIADYPKDNYLFGSRRNFKNLHLDSTMDFMPGENRLNRSTPGTLWRKLIKVQLGIDVNLYAMKHHGANKKILAGIELDTLRELYGHTSKFMTMRYAKVVKEVYRKQIIDQSPDF